MNLERCHQLLKECKDQKEEAEKQGLDKWAASFKNRLARLSKLYAELKQQQRAPADGFIG
jgi:hypothetical protein